MLPVLVLGDAYLERQAREEAEGELVALSRLAHDLVETQYASIADGLSRLADSMALRFHGSYSAANDRGGADFLIDGVPVSARLGDLSRFGEDLQGTLAAILVPQGDGFKVISSTRWGDDAQAPILQLERASMERIAAGMRWQGLVSIDERPFLLEVLPARDRRGRVVGAMVVGIDLTRALQTLRERLRQFVIGDTGYFFVVDASNGRNRGNFIVHPTQQGDTALVQPNDIGRDIASRMLQQGRGVLAYAWQNEARNETAPRSKLAAFELSESLGWLIGASGYVDEFGRGAARVRAEITMWLVVMAVLLTVGLNMAIRRMVMRPMLRLQRTLRTLSRGNEALVHSSTERELVTAICRILVHTGGYRLATIDVVDVDGTLRRAAADGDANRLLAALEQDGVRWSTAVLMVLDSGRHIHLRSNELAEPALRRAAFESGCASMIAFPLVSGGTSLGVLSIWAGQAADLDQAGVKLLEELAEDLGYGLMNLRAEAARQMAEKALTLRQRVIEASRDGVLILHAENGRHLVRDANAAASSILDKAHAEIIGRGTDAFSVLEREDVEAFQAALEAGRDAVFEFEGSRSDGSVMWSEWRVEHVPDGMDSCVVLVIRDVTERRLHVQQLEHQAHFDALTGLPNRTLLDDRLSQAMIAARRRKATLGVAVLDLDHFKRVNDDLGHRTGDRLLCELAKRFKHVLRDGDTAARQGGDEFVVLLPDLDNEEQAYAVLDRLQTVLSTPAEIDGRPFVLTTSIGVSLYPQDGEDEETLLKHADIALYQAKESGRNAIRFFTAEMNEQVHDRVMFEQSLRHALDHNEMRVVYQPQVRAQDGRCTAVEALLRWEHPTLGAISPARFIPVAEELGLIEPIGEWVLRTACEQAVAWRAAGSPVRVAVNVSVRQFRGGNLPERVAAVLMETGLPPELLELEITESMLMGKVDQAEEVLLRLKALGITIALDDFGTGYSSFSYLQYFKIDSLKIDQSFVRALLQSESAISIVSAIIAVAHSLEMRVIAEGVEMESQRSRLIDLGCDELQGYLIGYPLGPEQLALS
nr:EAL domain-containing protein [Azoarcus sp. L1K30]